MRDWSLLRDLWGLLPMNRFTVCTLLVTFLIGCRWPRKYSSQAVVEKPQVVAEINFTTSTLTGPVSKTTLATWWNTKLKIGSEDPDAYEFLTLSTNGQDKRLRVETCQQYTNAIQQGAYSLTTADMAMECSFIRAAGTLKFMGTAQASTHPLPDNFLAQLPVSLLGWVGSDEEAKINADTSKGITLKDYAWSGKVTKFKPGNHGLQFQTEARDFAVEELARGDWDGDGTEEALVSVTWHYREGSGFGYELRVVTKSANGRSLHLTPLSLH